MKLCTNIRILRQVLVGGSGIKYFIDKIYVYMYIHNMIYMYIEINKSLFTLNFVTRDLSSNPSQADCSVGKSWCFFLVVLVFSTISRLKAELPTDPTQPCESHLHWHVNSGWPEKGDWLTNNLIEFDYLQCSFITTRIKKSLYAYCIHFSLSTMEFFLSNFQFFGTQTQFSLSSAMTHLQCILVETHKLYKKGLASVWQSQIHVYILKNLDFDEYKLSFWYICV